MLRLLPATARITAGTITFDGIALLRTDPATLRRRRWVALSYLPQGAMNALGPVRNLGYQFDQTWRAHRSDALEDRARYLFARVGLEGRWLGHFPHEFSGRRRVRAIIALSLLFTPKLLVADEPTTGLDVLVEREILNLRREARVESGMALIFVSPDIAVVSELCDWMPLPGWRYGQDAL